MGENGIITTKHLPIKFNPITLVTNTSRPHCLVHTGHLFPPTRFSRLSASYYSEDQNEAGT